MQPADKRDYLPRSPASGLGDGDCSRRVKGIEKANLAKRKHRMGPRGGETPAASRSEVGGKPPVGRRWKSKNCAEMPEACPRPMTEMGCA